MGHRFPLRAACAVLAAAGTPASGQARRPQAPIAFTRLDTSRLEAPEAGTAVIRDSVAWSRLWSYFGREYRTEGTAPRLDSVATPPRVDFTRAVIVAVSTGVFGACGAPYISRIEVDGTRLVVVLGPEQAREFPGFCVEAPGRLDAAVVEGHWPHVRFVSVIPDMRGPPQAQWWTRPSVDAALESAQSALRDVSWRVLSRDSTLAFEDLRSLAQSAAAGLGPGLGLLGNARVLASPALLAILARGRATSRQAQALLFQLHADDVASDPGADTVSLAVIIAGLRDDHPDVAQHLIGNGAVQESEPLLHELIRQVWRDSATCHAAAVVYASRWPSPGDYFMAHPCAPPPAATTPQRLRTVQVTYACGTTFRVRNELATPVEITWDVSGTAEDGSVTLPPRGHRAYSERFLTTVTRGTLRLYRDRRMFGMLGNPGGRACQGGDTIPQTEPLARLLIADDTGLSVVPSDDRALRYYRTLTRVVFYDTTGGDQVRHALARWRATIVAGGPYPTAYVLRVPDPGASWSAVDSLLAVFREEPGVEDAFPVMVRERVPLR